ncbi:MAG: hypothetical protein V5A88_07690 [Candidatus Thermoplasmatota archaeon]
MNENILITGIVILVVGILLILLSMTGIMAFETAEETNLSNIEQEWTEDRIEFKNHSVGDKVVVSGEIVDKDSDPDIDPYFYVYRIRSGEDTGQFYGYKDLEVGENVTVTLEVEEDTVESYGQTLDVEYMVLDQEGEPFSILGLEPVFFIGIIVVIAGAAIAVLGVIKGKKAASGRPSAGRGQPRQQQQQSQQQPQQLQSQHKPSQPPPPPQSQQQPQQQQSQQPQQQPQQQQPQQQPQAYDLDADDEPRSKTQESASEEEGSTEE